LNILFKEALIKSNTLEEIENDPRLQGIKQ